MVSDAAAQSPDPSDAAVRPSVPPASLEPTTSRPGARILVGLLVLVAVVLALVPLAWRQPTPEQLWEQARAALAEKRFQEASRLLDTLSTRRPPTMEDLYLRGQVEIANGQNDAALAHLALVPDSNPLAQRARLQAGQVELRRGRLAHAEHWFNQALAINPSLIPARRELIYVYGMQLRRREIGAQFRALARLSPLNYSEAFLWCLTRTAVWDAQEQVEDLSRFLAADPDDRWTRLALAERLAMVNRGDDALKVLEALPAVDPESIALRAKLAFDRGDEAAGDALLAAAPREAPAPAKVRGRRALTRRDGASARDAFRVVLADNPDDQEAVFGMAQALRMLGNAREAEPYMVRVRDHNLFNSLLQRSTQPGGATDHVLHREIGDVCARLDLKDEARSWYQLVLLQRPLDRETQRAMFLLDNPAGSGGS